MSRFTILIVILFFASFSHLQAKDNVEFHHLGIESGLSQITINGLYQDEYGVMWIGTKDGVKRYNGTRVESVTIQGVNNWVSSSFVPTVCGDKNGHVFINTDYNIIEYDLALEKSTVIFTQENVKTLPAIAFSYGVNSLWIAMNNKILRYRNSELIEYCQLLDKTAEISSIREAANGKLYVGTKNQGLFTIDSNRDERSLIPSCSEIISIFEDSRGAIWAGTFSNGIYKIDGYGVVENYTTDRRNKIAISSNYVRAICEDDDANIWIGSITGLDCLDSVTGEVLHYGLADRNQSGLSNLSVWAIMKDNQGTMWFGTYYGGLDYCNSRTSIFKRYNLGVGSGHSYPVVSRMESDNHGDIWLATEGSGLLVYNRERGSVRSFGREVSNYNIKSLYYDRKHDVIWIGTHQGGLYCYDIARDRLIHYTIDHADRTTRSESILDIEPYGDGLFIGTLLGVYYIDPKTSSVMKVQALNNYIFEANDLFIDNRGELWVAGNNLCRYNPRSEGVVDFASELSTLSQSDKIAATCVYQDKQGDVFVGTAGFGVVRYIAANGEFIQYNSRNCNLPNDYVGSIYPNSENNLLVGTRAGFSRIDMNSMRSYNYDTGNGFSLHSMLPGCIIGLEDGMIVMGGVNGITSFRESILQNECMPFKMFISKLSVNNQVVTAADQTGILSRSIAQTDKIRLKYNENNISIEIGNDNFINSGQPQYQYMLDGYDDRWIDFSPKSSIRYMNLPYGSYTFKVRSQMFRESADPSQIALRIVVRPPWYATWYAYLAYVLVSLSMVVWIVYFYRSRLLFRTSLELERRDKQQKEMISLSKMRFFANVSHELRTPLTLITGQLELMLMSGQLSGAQHKGISDIHHGAMKMNQLISELLNFMKYNQGEFRLKIKQRDIVQFVSDVYVSFKGLAELKQIRLDFRSNVESRLIWFDEMQMQKVFNNLLSNAFKYTPANGYIKIEIESEGDVVRIRVADNGIGIPSEMKEKIFERFFQVENAVNRDLSQTGTGIGLSLTRNIVEAHYGTISVESSASRGSLFVVELPAGDDILTCSPTKVEIDVSQEQPIDYGEMIVADREFLEELLEQQRQEFPQQCTMLIIEDDQVLRKMLVQIFEPLFNTLEAANGEDGFRLARENSIDIILSDIMMPIMSGSELCRKIKGNFDTCHIPVVLLTALNSLDNNIQGLTCGADSYITKPFNVKLLVAKCVGLLNNRRRLQEKFSHQIDSTLQYITTNTLDQNFISKAIQIVEDNIDQGSINVTLLCSEMGISRTKLFLKIKGITGQTPHEFIQNIKLKVAAKMLRERADANISDIAYALGFSSLNYFGKYFKSAFGTSPTNYRKSLMQGNAPHQES